MEILTDLIRSWFGPDKMSDQAVFITVAATMATIMFPGRKISLRASKRSF